MDRYQQLHEELELLARDGQSQQVAKRLARFNTAKVPREWRLPIANVCRRSGLTALGLKLLGPVVRPDRGSIAQPPTASEIVEYSVLLIRIGALEEALLLLSKLDDKSVAEVHLYRAFCHIAKWDYAQALPSLKSYLASGPEPYQETIGRVNLAAALVSMEQFAEAEVLTTDIISFTKENGFARLNGNAHELRAQVYLGAKNFSAARADLTLASELLGGEGSGEHFLVQKWQTIMDARISGNAESLRKFRSEAHSRQMWEVARDMDLQALKIDFNQADFDYLLFGTPFAPYREKIRRELGSPAVSESFVLGREDAPCMDLLTCEISSSTLLSPGGQVHQTLEVLLRDFYRPSRVGHLFAELFPGEYFDVFSSPHRVHQVMLRARTWLKESGVPAEISSEKGQYALKINGGFAFRIPLERRSVERYSGFVDRLRAQLDDSWGFSARDARELLGLSSSAFKRFATWALENGHLERHGASSATFYKFLAGTATAPVRQVA